MADRWQGRIQQVDVYSSGYASRGYRVVLRDPDEVLTFDTTSAYLLARFGVGHDPTNPSLLLHRIEALEDDVAALRRLLGDD